MWPNPETGKESGDMNEGRANVVQRDSERRAKLSCQLWKPQRSRRWR
jgi:hypothetical protein